MRNERSFQAGLEMSRNLPRRLPPLIGRAEEVAAVQRRLLSDEVALLTLTGPGGAGKTRLALAVAAAVSDQFQGEVSFVSLGSISDPGLVLPTIAQAVGVREAGGQSVLDRLESQLRARQLLLVLDNFEHVVAAAPQVAELLAACSRLKVLATSRARLRLYGEHEFRVSPLALPDPQRKLALKDLAQVPSVALFIHRGRVSTRASS